MYEKCHLLDGAATERARLVIEALGTDNTRKRQKAGIGSTLEGDFVVSHRTSGTETPEIPISSDQYSYFNAVIELEDLLEESANEPSGDNSAGNLFVEDSETPDEISACI